MLCSSSMFMFIPNIICYLRIALLLICIYTKGFLFSLLYIISSSLDIADGYAARHFNQTTVFGAVLDMLIDRLLNIIIFTKIQKKLKKCNFNFILLLFCLDFLSNMLNFCGSLASGKSHKIITNPILAIYYDRNTLIAICSTTEIGFVLMYLMPNMVYLWILPYLVKSFFHLVQLHHAGIVFLNMYEKSQVK
ncbi:CDP-diacylglycerol--inositol 3-phosphatidyltransferase [Cucumispora dikerogammari]|nr:CDP-diacylglycerol--inositol 3-phosphatidyltransferase [Cucumispora dikerogammari]